jgi:hypothetical protein
MLAPNSLHLTDPVVLNRVYTLPNDITAMQILPFEDSGARLSPVCRLPRGARIEACGDGFDRNTLKVAYEGQYYFVFLDDLELCKKFAAGVG